MTDTIFRCLIQATFSLSSRVISLQAGLPSHTQEETIINLDILLSLLDILSILSLDILSILNLDILLRVDIPHSLKMYNPDIPHSLKLCIPSYQTKDTRVTLHLDMFSLLLNHLMSSLVTPSLCLLRGSLQVTLSESSCPK